ncbi:MAG: bifunctional enoyl-CoA hydratase/phosphate acetyltransferase [Burkholderiales bacterium]|nr:bifunctional enoyl-CoA hydratase/phosphate acetyltransferase [Burkholderiales bacterium]OJX02464.1 MAG: phosphate acetyltransferase [Burkholderiales bacterium 70-64]
MSSLFDPLRARARQLEPARTAVVYPLSFAALDAAFEAADAGYIEPVLVGPQAAMIELMREHGMQHDRFEIVDTPDDAPEAAHRAALLARDRAVSALMKGSLHTDEYVSAIVRRDAGLRTRRRLSHVFVFGFAAFPKLLALTDAAVNIAPDLNDKADIARNAIDLCRALGVAAPKLAVLAATETVNPAMPATIEAAALSKMAERGQIRYGIVDGPLAFDIAISARAAQEKGVVSRVAGDPDILLVPDIEAGNMLYKQAAYLAGAELGGLVLGAAVPVLLTSRADSVATRINSCVLANLYTHWLQDRAAA